jgi:hypothetical protein
MDSIHLNFLIINYCNNYIFYLLRLNKTLPSSCDNVKWIKNIPYINKWFFHIAWRPWTIKEFDNIFFYYYRLIFKCNISYFWNDISPILSYKRNKIFRRWKWRVIRIDLTSKRIIKKDTREILKKQKISYIF